MSKENGNIEVGDIVRLKSGGPKLTVSEAEPNSRVMCLWFLDGKIQSANIEPLALELVIEVPEEYEPEEL